MAGERRPKADIKNSIISGVISGSLTALTFQPFEFVKTRLQQPEYQVKGSQNISKILRDTLVVGNRVRLDRAGLLFSGLSPSLVRSIPTAGIYFATLEYLKYSDGIFAKQGLIDSYSEILNLFIIGCIARTSADMGTYPLNLIKTRFESDMYNYGGIMNAFRSIVKKDGWIGLYRGVGPTLVRDLSYSGVYFPLYTKIKDWVSSFDPNTDDPLHRKTYYFSLCALLSSTISCAFTQPPDVVRSYVQLKPDVYKKFWPTVKHIYAQHGLAGFFSGFWPRSTRRILISVMSWTVYEKLSLK